MLNQAITHSFRVACMGMVDHHTLMSSFWVWWNVSRGCIKDICCTCQCDSARAACPAGISGCQTWLAVQVLRQTCLTLEVLADDLDDPSTLQAEKKQRGYSPGNWKWIIPPGESGSCLQQCLKQSPAKAALFADTSACCSGSAHVPLLPGLE